MEDKQRVYIKGDSKRGNEVIKLLTDLGGRNPRNYYGEDTLAYYYIDPNGEISHIWFGKNPTCLLLKEFYKEIKLPIWKPKYGEDYYFISSKGIITLEIWTNAIADSCRYEFNNCFKTEEEAEEAINKIKEVLNNNE